MCKLEDESSRPQGKRVEKWRNKRINIDLENETRTESKEMLWHLLTIESTKMTPTRHTDHLFQRASVLVCCVQYYETQERCTNAPSVKQCPKNHHQRYIESWRLPP